MLTVTNGMMSKPSSPLPPGALAKPSASASSKTSKRSGFIHTGNIPSATSAAVRTPAGVKVPVKILSDGSPCRMLLSGLPSPVAPSPVNGIR